jgi:hypothetical protein
MRSLPGASPRPLTKTTDLVRQFLLEERVVYLTPNLSGKSAQERFVALPPADRSPQGE